MTCLRLIALVTVFVLLASAEDQNYSFSSLVGSGSGTPYRIEGDERVTGVRVWSQSSYISSIQLRYGYIWAERAGLHSGTMQEFLLFDDEALVQISGKYSHYIHSLVFVTSRGRSLMVMGNPSGESFNMYPEHEQAELRFLSGTYHAYLTGISAHWAEFHESRNEDTM
ncbi:unnamed protein product [Knipowitschia caucasica]|uniref:Jacalin-type lectin domain-containing protein n=1 Tax=Knipowitschia caucasica TaxID=637954 RepID=A0AAV2K777_KNICA